MVGAAAEVVGAAAEVVVALSEDVVTGTVLLVTMTEESDVDVTGLCQECQYAAER